MRFVFDLIIKKPDNFYNVVWFFPFNKAWTNDLLGMKIEPFKKKLTHSNLTGSVVREKTLNNNLFGDTIHI